MIAAGKRNKRPWIHATRCWRFVAIDAAVTRIDEGVLKGNGFVVWGMECKDRFIKSTHAIA